MCICDYLMSQKRVNKLLSIRRVELTSGNGALPIKSTC